MQASSRNRIKRLIRISSKPRRDREDCAELFWVKGMVFTDLFFWRTRLRHTHWGVSFAQKIIDNNRPAADFFAPGERGAISLAPWLQPGGQVSEIIPRAVFQRFRRIVIVDFTKLLWTARILARNFPGGGNSRCGGRAILEVPVRLRRHPCGKAEPYRTEVGKPHLLARVSEVSYHAQPTALSGVMR